MQAAADALHALHAVCRAGRVAVGSGGHGDGKEAGTRLGSVPASRALEKTQRSLRGGCNVTECRSCPHHLASYVQR